MKNVLYTISEEQETKNSSVLKVVCTLSEDFVKDMNNDALRSSTLSHLHASIAAHKHAMGATVSYVIKYPSGVYTNEAGTSITHTPASTRVPQLMVVKEDTVLKAIFPETLLKDDSQRSKIHQLHTYLKTIGATLTGEGAELEMKRYKEEKNLKALKNNQAVKAVQKKVLLNTEWA